MFDLDLHDGYLGEVTKRYPRENQA
jgi:hypothetical protein